MTAPRDPIEAPATECLWCGSPLQPIDGTWTDPENTGDYCPEGLAVGSTGTSPHLPSWSMAAARDEGRQEANVEWNSKEGTVWHYDCGLETALEQARDEAVRQIRDRFAALEGQQLGHGYWAEQLDRILDDGARHGRSSDPEPAPEWPDPNALATALYRDYDYTVTPDDIRAAYDSLRGTVPALQATGEPRDMEDQP